MKHLPHSLNMYCDYEILNSSVKAKLGKSELAGFIEIGTSRGKLTIPMRSFVQNFLSRLQQIFAGENTSDITKLSTASAGASLSSSVVEKFGILLGEDDTAVTITDSDLGNVHANDDQCQHKATTFTAPFASNSNLLKTSVKRLFANASSVQWTINEVGLKTKKTASGASNAGIILISRDVVNSGGSSVSDGLPSGALFPAGEDLRVTFDLKVQKPETGGAVLNMLRLIYNLYFKGNANASPFVPRSSTVTVSHANASATSFFVVDGGAGKYWGIVLGYYDPGIYATSATTNDSNRITPGINTDENQFAIRTSLTYGANTVSAVQISANRAYFTVTRDITNNGTVNVLVDRIGLLSKGATADPSSLQADQVFLMVNKPVSLAQGNTAIVLQPGQTIRVTYTFEVFA